MNRIFDKLRATDSRKEKVRIIRENKDYPAFQQALYWAYNPFKTFGISSGHVHFIGGRTSAIVPYDFVIFKDLSDRLYTGNEAKDKFSDWIASYKEELGLLMLDILDKDLRCGINIKTINEAIPNLIPDFRVMLAQPFDPDRLSFPCVSSIKIDGMRGIYLHKEGKIVSRKGKEIIGLNHITDSLAEFNVDLDGELIIPGLTFQQSCGRLRSNNPNPGAQFWIFDTPTIEDTLIERRRFLSNLFSEPVKGVTLIPHYVIHSMEELRFNYQSALSVGYEGLVIKNPDAPYQRKRSWDWMKMKQIETIDVPVIGWFEGTGKYAGMMGGVTIELPDGTECNVGSGFSDEDRADPEQFMNKIVEVEYHQKTDAGSLRHPRFVRVREDK
jgi:DNA ligase-1